MKTAITLTNGTTSIVLNRSESILANFRHAATNGFNGGQTSFRNLWNGKVDSVKGFKLVEVETKVQKVVKAARVNLNASREQAIEMVKAVKEDINIVGAERQVYATTRNSKGRVQLDPKADGTFRVALYENSKHTQEDLVDLFKKFGVECEVKSQYVHAFNVSTDQAKRIINA